MNKLNHLEVMKYLPHRYPFLLIDKVNSYVEYESIEAIKNVTHNEPFFNGHFPGHPVMPGVLMIEAMAQAGGILKYCSFGRYPTENDIFYLAGIDNARFKRTVVPGDQLLLSVKVIRHREKLWKFAGEATVNGELACSADFMTIKAE